MEFAEDRRKRIESQAKWAKDVGREHRIRHEVHSRTREDGESTFRYDVVKACDRLALAGAILAKRIGSDTYGLWRAAMIKLGDIRECEQCKAVRGEMLPV